MKCLSIVYKNPKQSNNNELMSLRPVKKSLDNYFQKLLQKQHRIQKQQGLTNRSQTNHSQTNRSKTNHSQTKTSQTYRCRSIKSQPHYISQSIKISGIRSSLQSLLQPQRQKQKQKCFRSSFIKKPLPKFFSLKGINNQAKQLFDIKLKFQLKDKDEQKYHAKLICLKKLQLVKNTTILISVDFIINQFYFWAEQHVDQCVFKNWRLLQEHSNIVWIAKSQRTLKKLEKYAHDYNLRLDGVYQIAHKKSFTMTFSFSNFQKDLKKNLQKNPIEKFNKQIIVINSLNVQSINKLGYQQFYNSFPISKSLKCIVHYIQININDKQRFDSPLKILSKQRLPNPNDVNNFFNQFYKNERKYKRSYQDQKFMNEVQYLSKDQMNQTYQQTKKDLIDYFSQNLKIPINKKFKIEESQISLQYLIGDMLKRNFNLMYNYQKQASIISRKLQILKRQQISIKQQKNTFSTNSNHNHNNHNNSNHNNHNNNNHNNSDLINNTNLKQHISKLVNKTNTNKIDGKMNINDLLNQKLNYSKDIKLFLKKSTTKQINSNQFQYKFPVFLWKN